MNDIYYSMTVSIYYLIYFIALMYIKDYINKKIRQR